MRAVLFDLDGTLADTAPDLAAALNWVRMEHGLPPMPYHLLRPKASHGVRGLLGVGFGIGPDHADYAKMQSQFLDYYQNHLAVHTTLFDGVTALLGELLARGLPWGIITNKASRFTDPLLCRLPLPQSPAVVVSGDTVGVTKPDPKPMLFATDALQIAPVDCIYVGDAQRDIEAGSRVGMTTLVAQWGYIGPEDIPGSWGADGMIAHPMDVLAWV